MRLYYISKPVRDTDQVYVILKYKFKSQQIDLSPSIKCLRKDFGDGKGDFPIKKSDKEHLVKNEILRLFKEDVNRVIYQFNSEGKEPTTIRVRDQFKILKHKSQFERKSEITIDRYPVVFVLNKFEDSFKEDGKSTNYSKSVKYRVGILSNYISSQLKGNLDFYELNTDFYLKLQNYLINQTVKEKGVEKPKYSNTTISKIISQFRQFLIWSKKNKYVSEIDVDYRTKLPVSYKQVITLDENQIKQLSDFDEFDYEYKNTPSTNVPPYLKHYESWNNENYLVTEELRVVLKSKDGESLRNEKGELLGDEPTGKNRTYTTYELTKDIFLFSISTGLRWSDVVQIKINDYDYLKNTFSLLQQKTSMYVSIMENKLSKQIWKKYSKNKSFKQYLFPLPCKENDKSRINYNTKINHHLKQVGKILGFNNTVEVVKMNGKDMVKNKVPLYSVLSFHMGRKTHSTIGIKKGVDEFSISKQMGHTSLGQTKHYVGSNSEKLEKMFDFIEEDLKDIKETVHKSDKKGSMVKLSPDEVDKELEILKSRYERKLITKKVYEEKMKELI